MGLYPKDIEFVLTGVPRGSKSKVYFVDSINGSDSNPGTKWNAPLLTLQAAYALTVDLQNDVIVLIGNGTSYQPAAAVVWANSFTHLVGLCSSIPNEQRCRVKSAAALATTPFFTVSGSGCVFKNISFWHETTDALGLVNVLVSGGRNLFENCQFAGAVGTNNASGARSLKVGGASASGNVFKDCTIGNDTIQLVAGVTDLEFVTGAMHTSFLDCVFTHSAGSTANAHVTAAAAAGVGRMNIFKRCLFINEVPSVVQAEVVNLGASLAESNVIFMIDCWKYGVADWDHNNRGVITNITIAANTTGVNSGNTLIVTSS
jgi:hypothetical protein